MNLNKTMFEITYAYPKLEVMDEFYNTKGLLINKANDDILEEINKNGKTAVQKWTKQLSSILLKERNIINGLRTNKPELPEEAVNILNNLVLSDKTPDGIDLDGNYIFVPFDGYFNVVIKKQRGAIFEAYMNIEKHKTAFKLYSIMSIYGDEEYSIAFRKMDNSFGFALMYTSGISGMKGQYMVRVSYYDDNTYYLDDASKYIDVKNFGKGI
ncbi:MAG: hypothetical protein ACPL3A_03440 [Thermoanaerobacteraceae bacterium]